MKKRRDGKHRTGQSRPLERLQRLAIPALVMCGALLPAAGHLGAATPIFATYGSTSRVLLESPTKARRVESVNLRFRVENEILDKVLVQGALVRLACSFDAGRKGVKVSVDGTIIDPLGQANAVPKEKARTKKDGTAVISYAIPVAGAAGGPIEFQLILDPAGGKKIMGYSGSCGLLAQAQ